MRIFTCLMSAFLLSFPLACHGADAASKSLSIKGSDTMIHLVSAWAEGYMKSHKDAEVSVTGGGSGTGIAALINGTTDICSSSRNISKDEIAQAKVKGIQPSEIVVARDGISIVVNPSNPIDVLSLDQLKAIYTGKVRNWKELGGADKAVLVFSRESSSGTYIFFQEHVMNKEDYTARARLMPATQSIVQAVADDSGAIGYVGLGYAKGAGEKVKVLKIKKDAASSGLESTEANVQNGSYPVSRPLFFYVNGHANDEVKAFINFVLGSEGQKIVSESGYVTVGNQ